LYINIFESGMNIRALHILGSLEQGGSENQAVQLVKRLGRSTSVEIDVASLNTKGPLAADLVAAGFTDLNEFPLQSFYDANFVRQVFKCSRLIKERQIDIVQTHDFYSNVFGITAARLAGGRLAIAAKRETSGMRTKAQDVVEKFIFGLADKVVVNSDAVRQYLAMRGVATSKLELIFNGVDVGRFESEATNPTEELNSVSAKPGTKLITMVANLRHRVKNHPMLLRSAQQLTRKYPDVDFVLAGEGELTRELMQMSKDLGIRDRVHFLGRCGSVPALLGLSFAGVLTSSAEGFSNAILEYMAASLPVVSTDVGGAREAVVIDETGFLVKSHDAAALTEKLSLLIENPELAAAMGARGKERVIQRFSCEAQAKDTLTMYRRLQGKSPARRRREAVSN
jgi:glycosyltransferase involved in cell wall biosynthesis